MASLSRGEVDQSVFDKKAFYDPQEFPFLKTIQEHWKEILTEFKQLDSKALMEWPEEYLTASGKWEIFGMYGFGRKLENQCARFPITCRLLEEHVPGLQCALFSILSPHTHITPHVGYTGYSHSVLRSHLSLIVPCPDQCKMRVAFDEARWQEGEWVVFDDTLNHEVWNNSDLHRVVLIVDFPADYKNYLTVAQQREKGIDTNNRVSKETIYISQQLSNFLEKYWKKNIIIIFTFRSVQQFWSNITILKKSVLTMLYNYELFEALVLSWHAFIHLIGILQQNGLFP